MQMQNTRINRFGIDLSAITPFPDNPDYIQQVVAHLRDTKQNLSTKDLAVLFSDDLGMSFRDMYTSNFEIACISQISHPHGLYIVDAVYNMQCLIRDSLSAELGIENYYQNLITIKIDLPSQSILNPKKLAVWRNTSKMGNIQTRQSVSVRKWIGSTLVGLTDEQAESLAKLIDERLASSIELDIRHHSSYEFDAWERAYSSDKIRSCMHPESTCEVGRERTFTCYCTGYHGLPGNGLSLTVLYQDDTPVARAITFTNDGYKYYIRSYGDDRLEKWLVDNGYGQSDFAEGTILYTTESLIKPYVDGYDIYHSDLYTTNDGKHYWVLSSDGEYNLQTTDAYVNYRIECECCRDSYPEEDTYEFISAVDGRYYTVCESCADANRYYVHTDGICTELVFFHDGCIPTTNRGYVEYDNEYYEIDSLDEYDLRLIDGVVYHCDYLYKCEITNEYFIDSDDVYTDADQISTTQPVHFPYDCVSKEYWDDNVVECACGTLALSDDAREISTPSLGSVIALDDYWTTYVGRTASGEQLVGIIFKLADIERDYDYDPTEKMKAFRDYAIAFNKIQYLRFQELGV